MCKVCDQYKEGKIDGKEALKRMSSAIVTELNMEHKGNIAKHLLELSEIILNKEVPQGEFNEDLERDWWNHTHEDN